MNTYLRPNSLTDRPVQNSGDGMPNELRRYFHYLLSTGKYRTFDYWKRSGEPNPFIKKNQQRGQTTRSEIAYLIKTRIKSQR
jgi:hypothetical protein